MDETANIVLEAGGTEVPTPAGGARRYRKPLKSFRWCDIKYMVGESIAGWNKHKAPRLGAALAFYTLLSLAPLLLVVVSVVGLIFGVRTAENDVVQEVQRLIGPEAGKTIQGLLEASRNTSQGILATVFGVITLLFGASGVMIELRDALNTIWEVPTPELSGMRMITSFLKERVFSFALVLAIGFLLVVSLAISAAIAALGALSASVIPAHEIILHVVNSLISFIVVTGLFAAIYKVIPDVRIEWRDVILGGAVTSALFTIGKFVLGLYLGKASFASTYGAAASIVVMIVWVYYSGQIFFFGAEFTKVFGNRYGSQPNRHPDGMVVAGAGAPPTTESILIRPAGDAL